MAKLTMAQERHNTKVVRRPGYVTGATGRYPGWQATCSCGYVGRVFAEGRDTQLDADEHVEQMARAEPEVR